jgi:hypothetical protein
MERGRPPELGNLLQVIPVVQPQQRGVWTVTLASIEQWDTCFIAIFDVVRDEPVDHRARKYPWLEIEAIDQDGTRYRSWFGGRYGGGLVSGGQYMRMLCKFMPPLPVETASLRLSARLQLTRSGGGIPRREVVYWEDPAPWIFDIDLAARPSQGAAIERAEPGREPDAAPGATEPPPPLMRLQRVIPIVQERESGGWRVTAIATGLYEDGFKLSFRILGPDKQEGLLRPVLRVTEDRGRSYRTYRTSSGGGNGEPTFDRYHWRMDFSCWPAPASDCGELLVTVDELQILGFEPSPTDPTQGKQIVRSSIPGDWSFVVDLT